MIEIDEQECNITEIDLGYRQVQYLFHGMAYFVSLILGYLLMGYYMQEASLYEVDMFTSRFLGFFMFGAVYPFLLSAMI